MELATAEKSLFGGVSRKIQSITDDFQTMQAENRRLRVEKSLLEGQLDLERAKLEELTSSFSKIEEAVRAKDLKMTEFFQRLMAAPEHLPVVSQATQAADLVAGVLETPILNGHLSIQESQSRLFQTQAASFQARIDRLTGFMAEWSQQKQSLVSDLLRLFREQNTNHLARLESLSLFVQQLIALLKEAEASREPQQLLTTLKRPGPGFFEDDLGGLSSSFYKVHSKTTLEENKFLVFCLEQIKQKLEKSGVSFPMHLLESEFLLQNKDRIVADNRELFATVEQLVEANQELRKKVFVESEMRAFGKRVKQDHASRIQDIDKGLVFLSQQAKNEAGVSQESVDAAVAEHVRALETAHLASVARAADLVGKVESLEAEVMTLKATEKNHQAQISALVEGKHGLEQQLAEAQRSLLGLQETHRREEASQNLFRQLQEFLSRSDATVFEASQTENRHVIEKAMQKISEATHQLAELRALQQATIERSTEAEFQAIAKPPRPDLRIQTSFGLTFPKETMPVEPQLPPKPSVDLTKFKHLLAQLEAKFAQIHNTTGQISEKVEGLKKKSEVAVGLKTRVATPPVPAPPTAASDHSVELQACRLTRDHLISYLQRHAKFE